MTGRVAASVPAMGAGTPPGGGRRRSRWAFPAEGTPVPCTGTPPPMVTVGPAHERTPIDGTPIDGTPGQTPMRAPAPGAPRTPVEANGIVVSIIVGPSSPGSDSG